MSPRIWLLYGAYGYTGRLIAQRAVECGEEPILAGRDERRLAGLAEELSLPYRVFGLDDPDTVARGVDGTAAVLHAAGPFALTYRPMVEACLARRCHYLDITGEIAVLEGLFALNARAREKGVVLLPGVGFDVVPTDCLAARVTAQVPDATHLDIAFLASGRPSGGTMKGMVEALASPGWERQAGRLVEVPLGSVRRRVDFSDGERELVSVPWGDVTTAWHSTGVPNVRTFTRVTPLQGALLRVARTAARSAALRTLARAIVGGLAGPGYRELADGGVRCWAEARNDSGRAAAGELAGPNGYALTADAAVAAVRTLLAPGYDGPDAGTLTPSLAFGPEFVDGLDGVRWVRLP